jgi:hypothetical protein
MSSLESTDAPLTCTPDTTSSSSSAGEQRSPATPKSASDSNGFRWIEAWRQWVPIDRPRRQPLPELLPLPTGPLEPEKHRCNDPRCVTCWNAGQRYAEYRKQKALEAL